MSIHHQVRLIHRGKYSYALPLTREDLVRLHLLDDPDLDPTDQVLNLNFDESQYHHKLIITKAQEDQANHKYHNDLDHMFKDFFARHPEIKDKNAYLQLIHDKLANEQSHDSTKDPRETNKEGKQL